MPLIRRIPKRGFHNHFANDFSEINLGRIQWAIDQGKLKADDSTITGAVTMKLPSGPRVSFHPAAAPSARVRP